MGSIEFLTTIFMIFRLYALVRMNDWQPCPFSLDCVFSIRYGNYFPEVNCSASNGWPEFNESSHEYNVQELKITGDVSSIPANGLVSFKAIGNLQLIHTVHAKSVQWDETAFKDVVIKELSTTNLADVIPPPAAMKPLDVGENGLQTLIFRNVGKGIRLEADTFIDFSQLTTLIIENTEITHIDDDAFYGLNQLGSLKLRSASLSSFPSKALDRLSELYSLDLSGNRFCGGEVPGLPGLPFSVYSFHISHNSLSSIPTRLLADSLDVRNLYMEYNNISSVKSEHLKRGIETLKLNGNPITSIDLRYGPASVRDVYLKETKLRSIDLAMFTGTGLMHLELSNTRTLKEVSMSKELPGLKYLYLDDTSLKHIDQSIQKMLFYIGPSELILSLKNNKNLICDKKIHWLADHLVCSSTNKVFVEGSVCYNKKSMPLEQYLRKNAAKRWC